ncbi:MAG: helix-turn-helix domain-containing protein, partial [Myxococcales bacterium]|nr:helix-turn-helix domain-containing protein [Myxococcales bacterium]
MFGGSEERGRTAARRAESAAQGAQAGGSAVGAYLAAQRRLRGISLDELAERTVIPRRNLERLESGAFDGNADGFTRGFVRTVSEA